MEQIITVEGPVLASRVFQIFSKAGGLSRIYGETRKLFLRALETALDNGAFAAEQEASEDPTTWILRLPSQNVPGLVVICTTSSVTLGLTRVIVNRYVLSRNSYKSLSNLSDRHTNIGSGRGATRSRSPV